MNRKSEATAAANSKPDISVSAEKPANELALSPTAGHLPSRQQAWALLTAYNQEDFHLRHAKTVECLTHWFAKRLGYGHKADFWALVGLLRDCESSECL